MSMMFKERTPRYRLQTLWLISGEGRPYPLTILQRKVTVLHLLGCWAEAGEVLHRNLERAHAGGDRQACADCQRELADNLRRRGEYPQAIALLEQAEQFYLEAGVDDGCARTANSLGNVRADLSDFGQAMELFQRVEQLARSRGDRIMLGRALRSIGRIHILQNRYQRAMEIYGQARDQAESDGDLVTLGTILGNIGMIHAHRSEYDLALEHYRQQMSICRRIGDLSGISDSFGRMGIVYMERSDPQQALECFHSQLKLAERMGDAPSRSRVLGNIGIIHAQTGAYKLARAAFEQQLQLARQLGDRYLTGTVLGNLGGLFGLLGEAVPAMECHRKRLAISEELGDRRGLSIALDDIGCLLMEENKHEEAEGYLDRACELGAELGIKFHLCSFYLHKVELYLSTGRIDKAESFNRQVLAMAEEIQNQEIIWEGKMFEVRLLAEKRPTEALGRVGELLSQNPDARSRSELLFRQYQITGDDGHRREALASYRDLLGAFPNTMVKARIQELEHSITTNDK